MEYSLGFLFNSKGKVALIRRSYPGWQLGKLNGIGGHIEQGETPLQSMRREFKEEAGVEVLNWHFFCLMEGSSFKVHCFTSIFNVHLKSKTEEKVRWYTVGSMNRYPIAPNLKWLVPMASCNEDIVAKVSYGY